ncbi:MAG: DUF1822 family protein [Cyanobacteria bacterium J06634_6]
MASPTSSFDLDLEKVYLDIDPAVGDRAWQRSQRLSNAASRWRAYINELAMRSLISWLQSSEDTGAVRPTMRDALWPTVWEWVTGSVLNVDGLRWVVIPTEAIDDDELRVPQEWVDIPNWAGDYYVLAQVNADDGWVKIAGLATHAMVKGQGEYGRDRNYSLSSDDLLTDINVVEIAEVMAPEVDRRVAIAPVPELPLAQANQLMQRLSDSGQLNPRLAVGFGPWSALLAHGGWRTEMTHQRQGNPPSFSVSQWLQEGLSDLVQQLGWQTVSLQLATVGARGDENETPPTAFSKALTINSEAYSLQISEIVDQALNAWRFELRKVNGVVPEGVTLRLLTEDLQSFANNEVTAAEPVESLYVDVALSPGEGIVWATEPEADAYESEILRF